MYHDNFIKLNQKNIKTFDLKTGGEMSKNGEVQKIIRTKFSGLLRDAINILYMSRTLQNESLLKSKNNHQNVNKSVGSQKCL